MKVLRKAREDGPRFTIAGPAGERVARHPGELLALVEAQRDAERASTPVVVMVVDEDVVLFTVERAADRSCERSTGGSRDGR